MEPRDFGIAIAAIINAVADLIGESSPPGTSRAFVTDLTSDLATVRDRMPDGAAKQAVDETVAALRKRAD